MKSKLIIISDLWGVNQADWLKYYISSFSSRYEIKIYDSRVLAQITTSDESQESIHEQFIDGGIDKAITTLSKLEKEPNSILAFSIGGTIAWKYGLKTGKVNSLTCVSSTRLRKENTKPSANIHLVYGAQDKYKPTLEWLSSMNISHEILSNQDHNLYQDQEMTNAICDRLLNFNKTR